MEFEQSGGVRARRRERNQLYGSAAGGLPNGAVGRAEKHHGIVEVTHEKRKAFVSGPVSGAGGAHADLYVAHHTDLEATPPGSTAT